MTAQQIRDARARLGLTQQALAEALGVDTRTVRKWENGERDAPAYLRRAIEGPTVKRNRKPIPV